MDKPAADGQEMESLRRENAILQRQLEQQREALSRADADLTLEAALERVRARALAMQKSEDLIEVSSVLFDEFAGLGIPPLRSSITTWDEARDLFQSWATRTISARSMVYEESLQKHAATFPTYGERFAAWQRGEPHCIIELAGEQRVSYFRDIKTHYNRPDAWFEEAIAKLPDPMVVHLIFFSHGNLEIDLAYVMGAAELRIAKRFAEVFDIAYRRYGELQQLEQQNKDLEENLRLLRETQNQLVLQEKMASLGDLVAGVAHEMNTPLGAISSMHDTLVRAIDKLQRQLEEDRENRAIQSIFKVIADANEVIANGTERVNRIVGSLRNFARLDEAEFQVVNLHEGIESALTLLDSQLGEKIAIRKNFGDIPPINCAPGQLNQVFMHLLKNAIEAIEDSGQIEISTFADQSSVCVRISDTGRGMVPEQLQRLFEFDFQTTGNRVKMGFGLAADYKILQDHKGQLKATSQLDKGTEMTVVLPL